MSRPHHVHGERDDKHRLQERDQPERDLVPEEQLCLPQGRGEQPLERAGRAFAQRGDAGDDEHHREREQRDEHRADPAELLSGHDPREQPDQQAWGAGPSWRPYGDRRRS